MSHEKRNVGCRSPANCRGKVKRESGETPEQIHCCKFRHVSRTYFRHCSAPRNGKEDRERNKSEDLPDVLIV